MNKNAKERVVVVGGGTGTHTVLRGLRRYTDRLELTAIVSMADSGGSTGRLRDEFGYLPVGDVRNALTALAAEDSEVDTLMRELFLYRFNRGNGLTGHNFGNLFLTALTDILGSESAAIAAAGRILRIDGAVVPVTTDNVQLQATYTDGVVVTNEAKIDEPTKHRCTERICELSLVPKASLSEPAAAAIAAADVIVLGPGDLYTSILSNCVVGGFAEALAASQAQLVYVCNLMSRRGQTTGYTAADHILEVTRYCERTPDVSFVNIGPFPTELLDRYEAEGEYPIDPDTTGTTGTICFAHLLAEEAISLPTGDMVRRSLIRHDSTRLAAEIVRVCGIG